MSEPTDILDTPAAGTQVIRGGAIRTAGYVIGVGLSVVAAAFMTRQLGVVDFGRYVVVMSLVGIVAGLSEAGLSNLALREYATKSGDDRALLMSNILGLRLAIGVLGTGAAVLFALVAGYDATMVWGTAIAGLALLLTTAQQTYVVPLQAALRLKWVSALELLRQAATVVAILVLVALDARLLAFFAISVPVALLVLLATLERVRGQVPSPAFQPSEWRKVLGVAAAYSGATAVSTVYVYAAVVVTSLVGADTEAGYLGAGFRIFLILVAVPSLLVTTAFPVLARAARDDSQRLQYASQRLFEVALIVGTWLSLATVLSAGFAIDVVAGSGFEPAVRVLQIYGAAVCAAFVALAWGFTLLSLHRHRVILAASALALVISVVGTLAMVPRYGAEGGAIATLLAELAAASFFGLVLFTGRDAMRLELRVLPRVAAAVIAGAAVGYLLDLPDLVEAALGTVAFGLVLGVLGGIPREMLHAFRPAREHRAT